MCGIFGIVSREGEIARELLARAQQSLAHRGPDSSGTFLQNGDDVSVGFAHTRLSIIDLSPLGHQPMQDPLTGNWIVFNGEIYNFRELRRELEAAGAAFHSHSDTEVILAAYREWGENCFLRLAGMFALGLWDVRQQRLVLARDPMGIKPLYYAQSGGKFLFASEVRTLLQTDLVPRKVDPNGVLSYLAFGSVYEPWTIVEGVSVVSPGHIVSLEKGALQSRAYWSPFDALNRRTLAQSQNGSYAASRLPGVLRDAVLSHLVSDVPVGVFLSGGIDSSSLVAVMRHAGVRASTFSLVFREEEFNEAEYSREVARRFGTDHHEILVSQQDALASMPEALSAMDQPTMDGINTWLVSAKARAAGVKVALTGLGADEMFAGYSNFRRVPRMEKFAARLTKLPALARRPVAASISLLAGKSDRNRKLSELASGEGAMVHPYFLVRALFSPEERRFLYGADYEIAAHRTETLLRESVEASKNLDPVNRVSYLESRWYMTNTLLRDSDFMSMAHGLELRIPFLDRALVETCFRIPGAEKIKGRLPKNLLLSSLGVELPIEIVKRPKRGFTLPFEKWLRREMRSAVEDVLMGDDHRVAPLNREAVQQTWKHFLAGKTSWSRPWSLFVLQRWCEQNL